MKKFFILLSVLLLLSGCNKSENEEFDNSGNFNIPSFSQDELDLIQMNVEQSNFSNSVNLKGSIPGKICYVAETDTLFYSDSYGLFQKNGDNIITLLDKSVISLNLVDGILYFIIPEGDDGDGLYGKAYRMNLENGKTECIIKDNISNMSVYKDKIFYRKTEVTEVEDGVISIATSFFKCTLTGEDNEQIRDYSFLFENDSSVSVSEGSIRVKDLQSDTINAVADEPNMVSRLSIYKNCIYYIRINRASLNTTAIKINLADNSITECYKGGAYFEDYGFLDDKLCLYDIGNAFYIAENEDAEKYECSENYTGIYSCGGKMYGLKPNGNLYELYLEDENGFRSVSETEIGEQ